MSMPLSTDELLGTLHQARLSKVRREDADSTMRQIAILLMAYLTDEPQTVRSLAARLRISKPAVTCGMDRLVMFDLLRRKVEPENRRSVIAVRNRGRRRDDRTAQSGHGGNP